MGARVVLSFVAGPLTGRSFEFAEHDVFVFGRGTGCHAIVTDDPHLSRHHFAIEVTPPAAVLRDLGSRNGTIHNSRRLGGRRRAAAASVDAAGESVLEASLRHGDVVRAGRTEIHVSVLDDATGHAGGSGGGDSRSDTVTMSAASGEHIAGHTLVRKIGEGASGVTWLARSPHSVSPVALKLVYLTSDAVVASHGRIEREVSLLSSLEHPNIVRLLGEGRVADMLWLALEYCDGGALGSLLEERRALPWAEARTIALGLLDGVAYAHARGIVHRDIKPDNVLLSTGGDVPGSGGAGRRTSGLVAKVADFGLAKIMDAAARTSVVTLSGSAAGTPAYMPREQILHFRELRAPSDVWSAAATIYRMLAGTVPRESKTGQDVLQTILEGRIVPLAVRAPSVPPKVAAVVDKALSTAPEQRFPDAGAMAAALREVA